jgi:outer membrane protein OmpA-like peptidoglycan-associated protein
MPRSTRVFSLIAALLATAAAAGAQTYSGQAYSGQDRVLLYPGGQYGRVVAPLREPGEYAGPINVRKPGRKTAAPPAEATLPRHATVAPAAPKREAESLPPVKRTVKRTAAATPSIREKPQVPAASDFGDLMVAKPTMNAKPAPAAKPDAIVKPRQAKPVRTAALEDKPRKVEGGGARRGIVTFDVNASDPSGAALQTINKLADDLNGSMMQGSTRIQLLAYAGPKGEKNSDSRRLSLKRALIVRQLLIDGGVPSDRIDVRAMGGADDAGAADRVDVFVKG